MYQIQIQRLILISQTKVIGTRGVGGGGGREGGGGRGPMPPTGDPFLPTV